MLEYSELTKRVNKLLTVDLNDQIQELMKNSGIIPQQDKDLSSNINYLLHNKKKPYKIIAKKHSVSNEDLKNILKYHRSNRNDLAHPTPERLNNKNEILPKYYVKAIIEGLLPFYKMFSLDTSIIYDYKAQLNYYNNNPKKMYSTGTAKKILGGAAIFASGIMIEKLRKNKD